MSEISVVPYREGDEKGIVALLDNVFDGWPHFEINCNPVDYWRWKYHDNPMNKSYIMIGKDGDKIIGCHHIQVINIKVKEEVIRGSTSGDLAVHPDYRGLGLMSKISVPNETLAEEDGVKLSYFITSNSILIKTFTSSDTLSKRRPRFPFSIRNHVRILDIDKQLDEMPMNNPWLIKTGWYALKMLEKAESIFDGKITQNESFTLIKVMEFDPRINKFWNNIHQSSEYIVERNQDYLNWKYSDPRLIGYNKVVAVNPKEEIIGYVVYKVNRYRERYPIGYIVDLVTRHGRDDVVNALVNTTVKYFDDNEVNIVNCQHTQGHPLSDALERHGFLDGRINIHMFYNKYGGYEGVDGLSGGDASRIHVSWGDHDALPVSMPKER